MPQPYPAPRSLDAVAALWQMDTTNVGHWRLVCGAGGDDGCGKELGFIQPVTADIMGLANRPRLDSMLLGGSVESGGPRFRRARFRLGAVEISPPYHDQEFRLDRNGAFVIRDFADARRGHDGLPRARRGGRDRGTSWLAPINLATNSAVYTDTFTAESIDRLIREEPALRGQVVAGRASVEFDPRTTMIACRSRQCHNRVNRIVWRDALAFAFDTESRNFLILLNDHPELA